MTQKILEQIKSSKGIILSAHINPDGDAIGALVGMATLCGFLHIPYTVILERVPDAFREIVESIYSNTTVDRLYDTFISVDCGDLSRLGCDKEVFNNAQVTINIDHHITNTHFASINKVHENASSTSEIIFEIIKEAGCPLTPILASALYAGILTDNGGFMHSCTQPSTHRVIAQLLEVPFDFTKLYYQLLHEKSEKEIIMQGVAAAHIEKLNDGQVFLSYITQEDLKNHQAVRDDLGSIITYIKNIKGCEVAALVYPNEDGSYKLSLRSNTPYDVAQVAGSFGGGGHVRASGATLAGTLDEVLRKVKNALVF